MSYILDALNKSEQERQQREHGVTLQPLAGVPHGEDPHRSWMVWGSIGIVLAAMVIFATVYFLMRGNSQSTSSTQTGSVAAVTVPAATANSVSSPAPAVVISASKPNDSLTQQTVLPAAVPKPTAKVPGTVGAASGGGNDSVKSLYQRKGMTTEQARTELPVTAPAAVKGKTEAVKTFASDEPATVRTPEADQIAPAAAEPRANLDAMQKAMQKERETELAARVQSEIEALQARDSAEAERGGPRPTAAEVADGPSVPLATDLPPAVQQRIPNIEFGAHVYAGKTGNGFVILNGKKRYAGDELAPGLKVERIAEDGVILDMGGTRFKLESMRSWTN